MFAAIDAYFPLSPTYQKEVAVKNPSKISLAALVILSGLVSLQAIANSPVAPKRLKIGYFSDNISSNRSGAIVSAKRFVLALKDAHDLTIVSTDCNELTKQDKSGLELEQIPGGYPVFAKNIMSRNGIKFAAYKQDKERIKEIINRSDVVYVHLAFKFGRKVVKWAKRAGKPVVVGFHLQPENILMNVKMNHSYFVNLMYKMSINRFYNLADLVICPSKFSEALLQQRENFKGKTAVISNGLPDNFRADSTLKKSRELEELFVILTVGRLAKEKRHDVIIQAIKESKYRDKIKLIATGSGAMQASLEKQAASLPIPARFGYVTDKKLHQLYNSADLYVHASDVELEGMSVLEAIGSGLPAVISDSDMSASKQFADFAKEEDAKNFLFKSGDPSDLAAKIDYLIENQYYLRSMKQNCEAYSKQFYFTKSVEKMLDAFNQVTEK